MGGRALTGVLAIAALAVLVLFGAWAGWYGPLVTCGADQATVCVAWPRPVSGLVWLGFVLLLLGLAGLQVALWRGSVGRDRTIE
jgi:hypothetical protein